MTDTAPDTPRQPRRGKIGVLIESHFDETEFRRFNDFFPEQGYEVEYLSHLWGQDKLAFDGNDLTARVEVRADVTRARPTDYDGILLIGGYAMDRLRYQTNPGAGQPNRAPAVAFLREAVEAMDAGRLKIGAICHSLWLFCADPALLRGRRVTCAHNIICDVESAGGEVVYGDEGTADLHVDGNLVTAKHPGVVEGFLRLFVNEIERMAAH